LINLGQRDELPKFPEQRIEDYCRKLQYNPLFIKWFVQGVRSGQRPEAILANPKIILEFCLQNVFNHLDEGAKFVAHVLLTIGGSHSEATLSFITEYPNQKLQQALTSLLSANIVLPRRPDRPDGDDSYSLSPLVLLYLRNYDQPAPEVQEQIIKRQNTLRSMKDEYASSDRQNAYNVRHVAVRDEADYVAARLLQRALDSLRRKDLAAAEALTLEAVNLAPNYFEAKRVEALLAVEQRNYVRADACYQAAMSLVPNHAPLRSWYGGFLARCLLDQERAIEQLKVAVELDPHAAALRMKLARLFLFNRQFECAETELSQIRDDPAILPSKVRSKYFDLLVQIPLRKADYYCGIEEYSQALHCAQEARRVYLAPGFPIQDNIIINVIARYTRRLLPDLRRGLRNSADVAVVKSLEDWFGLLCPSSEQTAQAAQEPLQSNVPFAQSDSGIRRGPLMSINRNYAFIGQKDRENLFFHRSDWTSDVDFIDLLEGTIVEFEDGQNSQGPCAVNVRLLGDDCYQTGHVQSLDATFGYIIPKVGGSIFFHRNSLRDRACFSSLSLGDRIRFKIGTNKGGKCADDVHPISSQ
jgi:LuxR family transcriptional regulator, glucitol operon activator